MTIRSLTVGSIKEEVRYIEKDTRGVLIESAQKLMAENGFQSTKVEEITRNAGVAKGTFYNYFASKEDALFEIVKEKELEFKNIIEQLTYKEENFENNLKKIIKGYLLFAVKNQEFFILITKVVGTGDQALNKKLKNIFHGGQKEKLEKIESILKSGIATKEISFEYGDRIEDFSNILSAIIDTHSFSLIFKSRDLFHAECTAEKKNVENIDIDAEVDFIYSFFYRGLQKI